MNPIDAQKLADGLEIFAKVLAEQIAAKLYLSAAKDKRPAAAKEDSEEPERHLYSVKDWVKKHPSFSEGGMRRFIFNAETNGFNAVIRRFGRRLLIDEKAFFEWLDKKNRRI